MWQAGCESDSMLVPVKPVPGVVVWYPVFADVHGEFFGSFANAPAASTTPSASTLPIPRACQFFRLRLPLRRRCPTEVYAIGVLLADNPVLVAFHSKGNSASHSHGVHAVEIADFISPNH